MNYKELLKDPRWQRKRLEILQRDDFTCRQCGSKENTLHVHHHYYTKGKSPWDYDNRVLVTLCDECHYTEETLKKDPDEYINCLCISGWTRQQINEIMYVLVYDTQDLDNEARRKFIDSFTTFCKSLNG
jgi:hypothetical protein